MKRVQNIRLFMVMSLVYYAGNAVAMDADTAGQALSNAARLSNLEDVQALIAVGANVNWRPNNNQKTPLIMAADKGYLEIVQALIAAGADVNEINNHGDTAFIIAARRGSLNILQALITAGADVNAINNFGDSAFVTSLLLGDLSVLQVVINADTFDRDQLKPIIDDLIAQEHKTAEDQLILEALQGRSFGIGLK